MDLASRPSWISRRQVLTKRIAGVQNSERKLPICNDHHHRKGEQEERNAQHKTEGAGRPVAIFRFMVTARSRRCTIEAEASVTRGRTSWDIRCQKKRKVALRARSCSRGLVCPRNRLDNLEAQRDKQRPALSSAIRYCLGLGRNMLRHRGKSRRSRCVLTGITKPQILFPMFRFLPWQLIGRDNRCFQPALRKVFWVESYNEVSLPCSKHRQNRSSRGPGEISD